MEWTQRKYLPHSVPLGIDPQYEIYFITVCCCPKGRNQLAHSDVASGLFETIAFRNDMYCWHARLFLLMPDHAHALMSFPPSGKPIKSVISSWKEWTAKKHGIHWQRDFFEHRLRHDESLSEKAQYILDNPVRAKLVSCAKEWPYVWFAGR
ncbi:MAG TPA: transposase [Candidatus Paceibacterota bacterium]|nr:transposase [Candidatus Paceibacterota bacterium]